MLWSVWFQSGTGSLVLLRGVPESSGICDSLVNVLLIADQTSVRRFRGVQEFYPAHNPTIPPLQGPWGPHPPSPETQKSRIPAERIPSMSHPHETPKNRHTTGFLLLYSFLQKTPQAKPLLILRASWFLTSMETNLSRQVGTSAKEALVPHLLLLGATPIFIMFP